MPLREGNGTLVWVGAKQNGFNDGRRRTGVGSCRVGTSKTQAQDREVGVRYAAAEQVLSGGYSGPDAVYQERRKTQIPTPRARHADLPQFRQSPPGQSRPLSSCLSLYRVSFRLPILCKVGSTCGWD